MGYKANVCLKSIAYELNVSINTVSRALRDCSDISEKTKKKVRQKALEMGYLPSNLLHSIKEDNSKLIALVINNISNYYFIHMSEKLMYYLKKDGYVCVLINLFGDKFTSDTVKECIYQRVDGIISFVEPTQESLEFLKLNKLSFLMLGRRIKDDYCEMLYTDDNKGGELAAKYLADKGCKNFVYVNINGSECATRRYKGFIHYLRYVHKTTKFKKVNIEDFKSNLENLRGLEKLGIFCYNDEHAFMVIDILRKNGFDLSQIEIIGYDAISQNLLGTNEIASIGFDYSLIAKTASYCITTNPTEREKICMCFDVRVYEKGERDETK